MTAHVLAVALQKGGAAKTTTTEGLAVGLAQRGRRVLAVDLDYQANLTMALLDEDADPERVVGTQLIRKVQGLDLDLGEVVYRDRWVDGLDLLASDELSANLAGTLLGSRAPAGDSTLASLLRPWVDTAGYDYVLIDTCPKLVDPLISNAFMAATGAIIPVIPEAWHVGGIQPLLGQIEAFSERNPALHVIGMVCSRVPPRRRAASQALEFLNHIDLPRFTTVIHEATTVNAGHNEGRPAMLDSPKRSRIAEEYGKLAAELDDLLRGQR